MAEAKKKLNSYKRELEKELGCNINFYHQGKTTYQLELTDSKKLSSRYKLVSSKKGVSVGPSRYRNSHRYTVGLLNNEVFRCVLAWGSVHTYLPLGFKRYHTDEVIELRDSLNEAEQLKDELVKATSRKVFR